MELDELKTSWNELETRLKRRELLAESFITDMIRSKGQLSVGKLTTIEIISAIAMLVTIPLIVFLFEWMGERRFLVWDIFMIYTATFCFFGSCWSLVKWRKLMHINFSESISHSMKRINRYKECIKRERMVLNLAGIGFCALGIGMYQQAHSGLFGWVFFTCMCIVVVIDGYWTFRKVNTHIDSVRKCLEELKELEEEA